MVRILFKDIPLNSADESNTPLIFSGFLGWYTPKRGKYHASLSLVSSGATSAADSSTLLMN